MNSTAWVRISSEEDGILDRSCIRVLGFMMEPSQSFELQAMFWRGKYDILKVCFLGFKSTFYLITKTSFIF